MASIFDILSGRGRQVEKEVKKQTTTAAEKPKTSTPSKSELVDSAYARYRTRVQMEEEAKKSNK